MKVLNIGSMNLDLVYSVDHIVQMAEKVGIDSRINLERVFGGHVLRPVQ